MRSPDRFVVITMLGLAVCAAFGLTWGCRQLAVRTGRRDWLLAGLVAVGLTLEALQIPLTVNNFNVSPFFEKLGRDQTDYSLLNLPGQSSDWPGANRMAEQTVHHKRIFDGYLSREYPHPFENSTPAFRELTALKFNRDIILPDEGQTIQQVWLSALSYYRVRYIVLDLPVTAKQRLFTNLAGYRSAIQKVVPGEPLYQDKEIEVYPVPPIFNPQPFIGVGDGWQDPEPDTPATDTLFHRWASGPANLALNWQGPGPANPRLKLKMGVLQGSMPATIKLDEVSVWSGPIGTAQEIQLDLKLTPGSHRLSFEVNGQAVSPKSLGMGSDPRKLLYYLTQVKLGLSDQP